MVLYFSIFYIRFDKNKIMARPMAAVSNTTQRRRIMIERKTKKAVSDPALIIGNKSSRIFLKT